MTRRTASVVWLAAASLVPLAAEVTFTRQADRVDVIIDGKPFTTFWHGAEVAKPYLWPLRAASGTEVTRRFPMVPDAPGDSRDHPQHRGLTFAHADLNGFNYWANEPFNNGKKGRIVLERITGTKNGKDKGVLDAVVVWQDADGKPLLRDTRRITFYAHPTLRMMDWDIRLQPIETVKFGDTHEGSFGVRVAAWLEEPDPDYVPVAKKGDARPTEPKRTGLISNSAGGMKEKGVRSKRALWADYSGEYKGEKLGIAMFDHPENPRHPTYWHTRGYGMFAANVFGVSVFENDKSKDGSLTLKPGEALRFRYRVVIHPGSATEAGLEGLYREFVR